MNRENYIKKLLEQGLDKDIAEETNEQLNNVLDEFDIKLEQIIQYAVRKQLVRQGK